MSVNATRFSAVLQILGLGTVGLLLIPIWVQADPRISPEGGLIEKMAHSAPMKIAVGPCQSQCFEGSVEYNKGTLKITQVERYDEAKKEWIDISATGNIAKNEAAQAALAQVVQSMTLPGTCPEEGCSCKMPAEKPPFSPWTNIAVTSDFVVKSGGKDIDYRAHGTVDYRSRVTQGQCDLNTKTSTISQH
jgi:hypothetical protein